MDDEARIRMRHLTSPTYARWQAPAGSLCPHGACLYCGIAKRRVPTPGSTEDPAYGFAEMASLRQHLHWFVPDTHRGTSIEQPGSTAPEMEIIDVTTVIGYLNSMQAALSGGYGNHGDLI